MPPRCGTIRSCSWSAGGSPAGTRTWPASPPARGWRKPSSAAPATGWPRRSSGSTCARARAGRPRHLLLDLAGTDDPVHGAQEGAADHGYCRQHRYHPLLVFDGQTDQLITAVLRPGNAHASHGVVAVRTRLGRTFRQRWPG